MAAALGRDLVLDDQGGDSGALIGADGAGDVDRVAEAGVGVGQDRDLDRVGEAAVVVGHLGQAQLPDVGGADQAGGRGIAAADHGLETRLGGQAGAECVKNARQNQDFLGFDQIAEPLGGSHVNPLLVPRGCDRGGAMPDSHVRRA